MSLVEFVVFALATWRLTSLLIYEDGPYFMFVHFRHWVGVRYYEGLATRPDSHLPEWRKEIAKLFFCPWCLSVWVGLLWVMLGNLGFFWDRVGFLIALPLAFSAVAVLYDKIVRI